MNAMNAINIEQKRRFGVNNAHNAHNRSGRDKGTDDTGLDVLEVDAGLVHVFHPAEEDARLTIRHPDADLLLPDESVARHSFGDDACRAVVTARSVKSKAHRLPRRIDRHD